MRAGPGKDRLGAMLGVQPPPLSVNVQVDQPGKQHAATQVNHPCSIRRRVARVANPIYHPINHKHSRPIAYGGACAIKHARARQPYPSPSRSRVRQQGEIAMRHPGPAHYNHHRGASAATAERRRPPQAHWPDTLVRLGGHEPAELRGMRGAATTERGPNPEIGSRAAGRRGQRWALTRARCARRDSNSRPSVP